MARDDAYIKKQLEELINGPDPKAAQARVNHHVTGTIVTGNGEKVAVKAEKE